MYDRRLANSQRYDANSRHRKSVGKYFNTCMRA